MNSILTQTIVSETLLISNVDLINEIPFGTKNQIELGIILDISLN